MRIGNGYDVHRLVPGRDLVLGGVKIDFDKGLLGHSDADVLVHAIMDSLLGAAGLRDIGFYFPDNDDSYSGISSIKLLTEVRDLVLSTGYAIINIDSIIVAQAPKLSPHIALMRDNISKALNIDKNQINIKATTEEHLGFTGNGSGISSYAVCLLE